MFKQFQNFIQSNFKVILYSVHAIISQSYNRFFRTELTPRRKSNSLYSETISGKLYDCGDISRLFFIMDVVSVFVPTGNSDHLNHADLRE